MSNASDDAGAPEALRIDLWLWRTRLSKTRALAAKLAAKGKVRRERAGQTARIKKASELVAPGDRISFTRGERLFQLEVISLPERRGSAPEAQRCYRLLDGADASVRAQ